MPRHVAAHRSRAWPAERPRTDYRPDIEGLRAVAVLAVVGFHAGVPGLTGGYVGVDAFYVISGFLITGLLWRELHDTGRVALGRFYARRARRLLPAASLVSVATVVAAVYWLPPLRARSVLRDALAAAVYAGNYRLAAHGTDYLAASQPPSPFQHYWSLAVEEQYYLCWPVLLLALAWLTRRRGACAAAVAVLAAGSFWLSLTWTRRLPAWAFFSLPSRAWELAVGGLLALAGPELARLPRQLAATLGTFGLAALAAGCTLFSSTTPFPATAALVPVLGAGAVIAAGCAPALAGPQRLLGLAPLRAIGRLSYSWYLWHWPVLLFAPIVAGRPLALAGRLVAALASLGLAAVTLTLLEDPVRRARPLVRHPRRGLLLVPALTGLSLITVVLAAQSLPGLAGQGIATTPVLAGGEPSPPGAAPGSDRSSAAAEAGRRATESTAAPRPPSAGDRLTAQVQSALAAALRAERVPANLAPSLAEVASDEAEPFRDGCLSSGTVAEPGNCFYAATDTADTVLLMGDSHAAQWFPALDGYAREHRLRLQVLGKGACPPLRMPVFSPFLGRDYIECRQWLDQAIADVRSVRPRLVVLAVARHYGSDYHFTVYSRQWLAGLAQTVREVRAAGSPVLVLGPIPKPPQDVPDCLSEHLAALQRCSVAQASALSAAGIRAEQAAVRGAGGRYLDLTRLFCTAGRCPVVVGSTLVYRDDNHLTTTYPGWLAPVLGAELGRLS